MPDKIDSAVRAPTPLILINWRNTARSSALPKPVREQHDLFADLRQVVEGAHRHIDLVADTGALDQQLRRIFFKQNTGETTDHRVVAFLNEGS
jgi:hypothetical protein